jgi:hypothetical protein
MRKVCVSPNNNSRFILQNLKTFKNIYKNWQVIFLNYINLYYTYLVYYILCFTEIIFLYYNASRGITLLHHLRHFFQTFFYLINILCIQNSAELVVMEYITFIFSSPGPKVQVNYCHHLASVVCCLSSVNFSHFKLLLRNHWANWNQTLQECSLDGPLQSYCFSFQSDIQHGCQGQ